MNNYLNKKRITGIDIIFLYLLILFIPILFMVFIPYFFNNATKLLSIYLALITVLILITSLNFIFNKPYIAVFFSCHQDKNKSIQCIYNSLNICARCTGIFLGIFISIIFILLKTPWYIYFILGIPLIIDGTTQYISSWKSNNFLRVFTGILFGPTILFVFYLFHYSLYQIAYYFYSLL